MKYRKGYKYQTAETETFKTVIKGFTISDRFFALDADGNLTVRADYAWDGASGPTFNTDNTMTPSLIHDAFYQMLREGFIPQSFRAAVDIQFRDMCKARGMGWFRDWYFWKGVEWFGKDSAAVQKEVVFEAP